MTLHTWYQSLAERERRTVLIGGIAAAVLLVVGGIWKLDAATARAADTVAGKRADLAWMQRVAPQLRAMPTARSNEALPLLVDRTAHDAGLAGALSGSEPAGNGGLRVRFEGASFDMLVVWLSRLQRDRGLVIESANIDGAAGEGLVNASLVLRGP